MSAEKLKAFEGQKYLTLETFRKNGVGVATPVWFAEGDGNFFVYSLANAGKVKRIRNNPRVRVAPCDIRGNRKGEWVEGTARFIDDGEAERAHRLLDRKYGLMKKIGNIYSRLLGRERAAIAISLSE